jgi:hypothetical protein
MQPGMHMQPGIVVPMTQMATPNFCPATGGAHTPEESTGIIGIIVGIVFCPIGLIA